MLLAFFPDQQKEFETQLSVQIPVVDMDMVRFGFLDEDLPACSNAPPTNEETLYDFLPLHSVERQHIERLKKLHKFGNVFPSRSLDHYFHPRIGGETLQELNLDQVLSRFLFYRFYRFYVAGSTYLRDSQSGGHNFSAAITTGCRVISAKLGAFLSRVSRRSQNVVHFDANSDIEQQNVWATETGSRISENYQNAPRNSEDNQTTSFTSDDSMFPEIPYRVPRQQILVVKRSWE